MTEFETQVLSELHAIRVAMEKIACNQVNNIGVCSVTTPAASMQDNLQNTVLKDAPVESSSFVSNQSLKRYYFGTPDGDGFEECNAMSDPESIRILYVVETQDGVKGRFYPLGRSMARLKSNAQAFLLPLCNVSTSIEDLGSDNISQECYGEVELKNGYWKVTRKCSL